METATKRLTFASEQQLKLWLKVTDRGKRIIEEIEEERIRPKAVIEVVITHQTKPGTLGIDVYVPRAYTVAEVRFIEMVETPTLGMHETAARIVAWDRGQNKDPVNSLLGMHTVERWRSLRDWMDWRRRLLEAAHWLKVLRLLKR